jgi:hypothetical protein
LNAACVPARSIIRDICAVDAENIRPVGECVIRNSSDVRVCVIVGDHAVADVHVAGDAQGPAVVVVELPSKVERAIVTVPCDSMAPPSPFRVSQENAVTNVDSAVTAGGEYRPTSAAGSVAREGAGADRDVARKDGAATAALIVAAVVRKGAIVGDYGAAGNGTT